MLSCISFLSAKLWRSVWFFPVLLFALVSILALFRISGSSVGVYGSFLNGAGTKDTRLISGSPQSIRSDEWLFVTQMTVAQEKSNYPRVNKNLGNGKDMSVVLDVPYKEWSVVFKPQNLAFFVLPFEVAFAFKWWLLFYLLATSVYFFCLRLWKNKRLFASMTGLAFSFSPFVFWWYQSITFGTLFYGFFALILLMRMVDNEPIPFLKKYSPTLSWSLNGLLLTYVLVCWVLLMYPPFLISVAVPVLLFFAGYVLQKIRSKQIEPIVMLHRIGIITVSAVVAGLIVCAFLFTRMDAVKAISGTVYPGTRVVPGGDISLLYTTSGFLSPLLQKANAGLPGAYIGNQCEASNFVIPLLFLIIPAIALMAYEWRKKHTFDWVFLSVNSAALLLYFRMFFPHFQSLYHILLFQKVPTNRMLIGLGFIGIIQFILITKKLASINIKPRGMYVTLALTYGMLCLVVLLWTGSFIHEHYPVFLTSIRGYVGLALVTVSLVVTVLLGRPYLAVCILLVLSFASVKNIHPLYRGLGFVRDNKLSRAISEVSKPGDAWVALDNIVFENIGPLSNRNTVGGIQHYPDLGFWNSVAPGQKDIFNRYAHIIFTSDQTQKETLRYLAPDAFAVKLSCNDKTASLVDYVVSEKRLNDFGCAQYLTAVSYPARTFYLYRIQQ